MPNQTLQNYTFTVESNTGPRAVITPAEQETVIGAIVKMDGRASFDTSTNPSGILNYHWSFARVPIGSQVELEGFTGLDPDNSVVTFAPDITGFYQISLVVDDGSIFSDPFIAGVDVQVIAVPNNKGIVPDASFIWNYLSDFWSRVEERSKFEIFWSSAIQIVAAELLKQYQYDYNKSIRDIQKVFQKRWVNYASSLVFDRTLVTGILAEDQAGLNASTSLLDVVSAAPLYTQPDFSNLVIVPLTEGNFVTTSFGSSVLTGRVLHLANRSYTMARSNNGVKAVNEGNDGTTTVTSNIFSASGFDSSQIGMQLRVLSGADKGTYLIATSPDQSNVTVTTLTGGIVSFVGDTAMSYTVVPSSDSISNFFGIEKDIATKTAGQPWRFSSTIITTEYDLEAQGVSTGDLIEFEIIRIDLNLVALVQFQVIGVNKGRVSFVFNIDDLVDGTPSRNLSTQSQIDLAGALQVTGLMMDSTGNLQYTLEASLIKSTVSSQAFKRTYFETVLTPDIEIDLGAFKVKARPTRVIRNSKIAIDSDTISVPVLQEYIRQPDMAELDGVLQVIDKNGKLFPIDHTPYVLSENLDYIIDDESMISGIANTTQNFDIITVPRGDLIDRSVQPGDQLTLTTGATEEIFTIRKVISPESIRVFPIPTANATNVPLTIARRVKGKFIRFTNGTFTKTKRCPDRLWAELTYFSNDANIEANFGVLVGITRDDLKARNVQAPYKSVVEGLMYALVQGPVQENLRLSAQILLGLPFALNSGTIIDINPSFRTRPDGSPLFGRILVEGRDKNSVKTGITDVYLYPQGRQLPDPINPGKWVPATPTESGIGINLTTGVEYQIGDHVDKFDILSKGVDVSDYLSDPTLTQQLLEQGTLSALITQYHSFKLSINSDITTPSDINITTEFIKTAKPHYVNISAGLLKNIEDNVTIDDVFFFKLFYSFFDNVSYSLPTASKFDTGLGETSFISPEGIMYTKYLVGTDLDTTYSSSTVFSTIGGFVTPAGNHLFDAPFIRAGDLLIITTGPNKGPYSVASVVDDNHINLSGSPSFQTLLDQPFGIYRPVQNPLFESTVAVVNGSPNVIFASGGFSAGIAVGDILTFTGGAVNSSRQYTIIDFTHSNGHAVVSPSVVEATATYSAHVWREALVTKYLLNTSTATPFQAGFTNGSAGVVFVAGSSDLTQLSFIKIGDQILRGSDSFTVLDYDPTSLTAYVTPIPAFTAAAQAVKIWRPYRATVPMSVDILDRMPDEFFYLNMRLPVGIQDLTTTNGSTDVTTVSGLNFVALGVEPEDFLIVLEGADSTRDIGYGAGLFPIQNLPSNTSIRLTRPLTSTHNAPGIRYGVQRRRPSI